MTTLIAVKNALIELNEDESLALRYHDIFALNREDCSAMEIAEEILRVHRQNQKNALFWTTVAASIVLLFFFAIFH